MTIFTFAGGCLVASLVWALVLCWAVRWAYLRGANKGYMRGYGVGHTNGEGWGARGTREAEKRARTAEEALDYIMHEIVKREFPPSDSKRRFPGPDLESQVGDTIDLREPQ